LRRLLDDMRHVAGGLLCAVGLAVVLAGCGSMSGGLRSESSLPPVEPPSRPESVLAASATSVAASWPLAEPASLSGDGPAAFAAAFERGIRNDGPAVGGVLTQAGGPRERLFAGDDEAEPYDPWEPFNERVFEFNRKLDQYVLKPIAKTYNVIMPEPFQVLIANGFDNIRFVPRVVNSVLQNKWAGAGREVSRFVINSTLGIGGLFDAAKYWGIEKSREDFGQTLAVWGSGPGPYLIVPFLPPLTVRDGIGRAVDTAMDPLGYFLPFIWTGLGMTVGDTVNERSLNLDLFQGFEESVIDMYSAVRHGYLQRRKKLIRE